MIYKILLLLFVSLFFGCSSKTESSKELRIATNSWIGYTPLFYLKEIGALKQLNIKLIYTVSLAEASEIFEVGNSEMGTTTQHEYYSLKELTQDIIPVILIDRSDGGDMILSNKTLTELKYAQKIYAYLEIDSINNELLKAFLEKNKLSQHNIVYTNMDQLQISKLQNNKAEPMLIVTYFPYNIPLQKHGFYEIASTKNIDSLVVIDALCIRNSLYNKEKERLKKLKILIDKSIEEIKNNPKKVYESVAKYLNNITYDEFLNSLKLIKWINTDRSQQLNEKLEDLGYKGAYLIK